MTPTWFVCHDAVLEVVRSRCLSSICVFAFYNPYVAISINNDGQIFFHTIIGPLKELTSPDDWLAFLDCPYPHFSFFTLFSLIVSFVVSKSPAIPIGLKMYMTLGNKVNAHCGDALEGSLH